MSIRVTALYILVFGLSVYAWKDWFKSLCGLILLMAIIQHEDMPKTMFGIQGFNTWNILFLMIVLAWFVSRSSGQAFQWDMPRYISILLLLYLGVIFIGFLRAVFDRSHIENYPLQSLISEELINTVKWILPGILLFYGCRSRKQVITVLASILVMYFLLAVQVVKRLPPTAVLSGGDIMRARKVCDDIGYSAVDMSVFLAGASWALLATLQMFPKRKYKALVLSAAGLIVFAQALTGGRAGYLAWAATGLVLCLLKWRRYLLLVPVVIILLPLIFPGVVERMFMGFGETNAAGQSTINDYEATAGRTQIWPYVIDKIGQSPFIGYGRLAMKRTGLTEFLGAKFGESEAFPHPHNMYLETLLDNGIIGSTPIFLFWLILVFYSAKLFTGSNHLCSAAGGVALAMMLTQLFAGIGSQHFYPRESTFGLWAAMFLMLRVHVEQLNAQTSNAIENYYNEPLIRQQNAISVADASLM
jgi:hypothetical protein